MSNGALNCTISKHLLFNIVSGIYSGRDDAISKRFRRGSIQKFILKDKKKKLWLLSAKHDAEVKLADIAKKVANKYIASIISCD